ncbi:hypothetical protein QFZ31_004811 [Neobacillus niacini]|nr:hypothetical protein [Neobacillus niacini]
MLLTIKIQYSVSITNKQIMKRRNDLCLTTAAMFFGLVMNFSFFLAGTVSHNPTDIFLGFIILTAGYNAGRIGLDRWVVPFFNKTVGKTKTKSAA